jgi:hypothetical protein
MFSSGGEGRMKFVCETPELYNSKSVQGYISQEIIKPSKHWVQDVIANKRESENVKLRTVDFVFLPDTNANKRQYRQSSRMCGLSAMPGVLPQWASSDTSKLFVNCVSPGNKDSYDLCSDTHAMNDTLKNFNLLSIVTYPSLKTIRDLRGHHIPMLQNMYQKCMSIIENEYCVSREEVMVYANYPPSVYRLHFHFCAPFAYSSAFDAFRMHPLKTIINNLKLNGDYYLNSSMQIPVHASSELHKVLRGGE